MPSLKDYRRKLNSLVNTRKVTQTMKLVSASKLRQAQTAQSKAKVYAAELTQLIARLAASVEDNSHPLLLKRDGMRKYSVLLVTSDKGLCGGFNNNLCKQLYNWYQLQNKAGVVVDFNCVGKRGYIFLKNRITVKHYYEGMTAKPQFANAQRIGKDLMDAYISGECDCAVMAFNQYNTPLSQTPLIEKLLPVDPEVLLKGGKAILADYIFEPAQQQLLEFLIPKYLYYRIYYTLLENSAGEHGARMTAMDKATQNASDLITKNTLLRNRARQAAITKELIEIVSGAEALK